MKQPPNDRNLTEGQEQLIKRFANIELLTWRYKLRFYVKRLIWVGVVQGAYLMKRLIDVTAAALLLALFSPLYAGVALAIRLDSPGPIFFKQIRVGRWGTLFPMWKFRSMYIDAEERKRALMQENEMAGGVIFKMKRDPRITRVGRFIRKASIDELPQLWNVLVGDMSLVGPRPPLPVEVNQYSLSDRRRLDVVPGITCIWQVSGRSDIPFDQQVQLDVQYIESRSICIQNKH